MAEVLTFLGAAWLTGAVLVGLVHAIYLLEAAPSDSDIVDAAVYTVFWPVFCVIRGWPLVLKEINRER